MKKGNVFAIAMFAGLFTFSSCAMKKDLVNCQKENKELTGNYQTAKEDLAASKARVAALEEQLNASKELLKQQKADYAALQASLDKSLTNAGDNNINISKLVDQINESNQYIRHLVEVKSKSDSLNMVLTNNLTRSLSKEEMKEVDVQVLKGVVYISLADNMLYKSGSYEINERASETLSKIAKIITDYKDYEVLIEGNTDNVPVNAKAASMKNIRNNWDLSCLRASSVVQALQNQYGVDPKRLTAGGRGEYNPASLRTCAGLWLINNGAPFTAIRASSSSKQGRTEGASSSTIMVSSMSGPIAARYTSLPAASVKQDAACFSMVRMFTSTVICGAWGAE